MSQKEDVRFPADGGIDISGWMFLPEEHLSPVPAITMAHGYAGTKYHRVEPMAEAFAAAGFAVLLHDHRGFGDSGGEPRQDVNPWQQIADWRRAISYLQGRPEVDEDRVGLWGTSYAGGHAIVLGATDRRLRAVVAQVPTTDGYAAGLRRVAPGDVADLEALMTADDRAQLAGASPAMQPIVVARADGASSAYHSDEEVDFYLTPVPEGVWENEVTVRSTWWARHYAPGHYVERVSPTPLLMIVADHDTTSLTDLALATFERAHEPKRLVLLRGGHFDPYVREFEAASCAAVDWFSAHLV
jgi:uncharacterized protein